MTRKLAMVVLFGGVLFLGGAQSASAGCFVDLADCFQRAAGEGNWARRWLMGLDCELDFIDCAGNKIWP